MLQPVEDEYVEYVYRAELSGRPPWRAVIVTPPEVFIAADSEYSGVEPRAMAFVADSIMEVVTEEIGQSLELTEESGPGVLIFRLALSDVRLTRSVSMNPFSYTPFGMLRSALFDDFKDKVDLTGASIELEFIDSQSGGVVGAAIERFSASEPDGRFRNWAEIDVRLRELGRRISAGLTSR